LLGKVALLSRTQENLKNGIALQLEFSLDEKLIQFISVVPYLYLAWNGCVVV